MNMQDEFKGKEEVNKYLSECRANGLTEGTLRTDYHYLKTCLKYINKPPSDIDIEDIERWKQEMLIRKYEPETKFRSVLTLRKLLRYLGRQEVVHKIVIPKRPTTIPPEKEIWLLPEEQKTMREKSKEMGIRDHAIISLFLSSGVRAGELEDIDISDIDFENHTIHIRHGKGDKSRFVCFDDETKQAILNYLEVRPIPKDGTQALFISKHKTRLRYSGIAKRVKECAVLTGLHKKITTHKLRHTFVTTVIEVTKDIPLAQKLAGHKDIKTTMRYHHSTHQEVVDKYRKYFSRPKIEESKSKQMSNDEVLKALDAKFLKGEMPYDAYAKLREEYTVEKDKARDKKKYREVDVAYG